MLWIILGFIIGVSIAIFLSICDYFCDFWEGIFNSFLGGLTGVMIGLFLMLFSSLFASCCAETTWSTVENTDIYALQDNLTTEGSFFLGSGHINDELKYFYVKETDIGYTVCNVDADNTYIRYTTDRCYVERQTCTFTNDFINLIAFPFNYTRYIFHIPDGSIMNNYAVDLK